MRLTTDGHKASLASLQQQSDLFFSERRTVHDEFLAFLFVPKLRGRFTNHSEADVSFLQRRPVVCSVSSHSNHFTVWIDSTLDDSLDQSVLVLRRRPSEDAQLRPDLVNQFLTNLTAKFVALRARHFTTRGQSNLTKSASRGTHSPVRGHPRGSKVGYGFLLVFHSNYRPRMHRLATVHARDNQRPTTNQRPTNQRPTTQPISISASFTNVK